MELFLDHLFYSIGVRICFLGFFWGGRAYLFVVPMNAGFFKNSYFIFNLYM